MNLDQRLQPAPRAIFFFAVTHAEPSLHEAAHRRLSGEFGNLGIPDSPYCFSAFSRYYDEELGGTAWKYFVPESGFRTADELVRVKLVTERIQVELSEVRGGKRVRRVNIDPGYVNGWQVVLATVKNHSHRIYLRDGVFCEVTLRYANGDWQALPWTYPDYTSESTLAFFDRLRTGFGKAPGRAMHCRND